MKQRCFNQANPGYANYGGRGITVCARWTSSYEAFEADMGPRPSAAHSIGLINNDLGYSPDNCRWIAQRAARGEPLQYLKNDVLRFHGDECLLWPYAKTSMGYGLVWRDGKNHLASRMICEELFGQPPTARHEAAHSCGQGHLGCVNPRHLRWATPAENEADKLIHGTHSRGERNGYAKLTEDQVQYVLRMKGRISQRKMAASLGVSASAIANIHIGNSWAWKERLCNGAR